MLDMYDGIRSLAPGIARQFPKAAKVAGYGNGIYAWTLAEWNLFPAADHVTISVRASANLGDALDVETGDATPDQTAGWIAMRKAAGLYRPTIYCSRSVIPAVRRGTGSYILGQDYDIWVADFTGWPHQVTAPGLPAAMCAATQWESTQGWDATLVYDTAWPHRKPPVLVPPALPAPPGSPGGLSGTPHQIANFTWAPVRDAAGQLATHYRVQVFEGTPAAAGALDAEVIVAGTRAQNVPAGNPGPKCWRVQVVGGPGRS